MKKWFGKIGKVMGEKFLNRNLNDFGKRQKIRQKCRNPACCKKRRNSKTVIQRRWNINLAIKIHFVKRKYLISFLKECSKYKGLQTRKAVFVTIL